MHAVYAVHSMQPLPNYFGLLLFYSQPLKLSDTINDMVAYTKVNDSLFLRILHSSEPELEKARKILEKIENRRLYPFIGQTNPKTDREDVTVTAFVSFLMVMVFVLLMSR